ncbi:hypothetical protein ACFPM7_28035 [Actinokineospora guangxiensis]|uniref:Uncharacterized protein n=1 Tax=Actinokineospora guangxiensis TaxID=1490288 RepID=A0ABW0EVK1_9PSEU
MKLTFKLRWPRRKSPAPAVQLPRREEAATYIRGLAFQRLSQLDAVRQQAHGDDLLDHALRDVELAFVQQAGRVHAEVLRPCPSMEFVTQTGEGMQ